MAKRGRKRMYSYSNERERRRLEYARNKAAGRSFSKEWAAKYPEKVKASQRNNRLKRAFGISTADYELLLFKQNGLCAICGQQELGRRLHVDHCHKTGIIRGLLCAACNHGLGKFYDSPVLLRKASTYLVLARAPIQSPEGFKERLQPSMLIRRQGR